MNFTFARNRTVSSLSGHTINFAKGESTHVNPNMYQEVIAAGGVPDEELGEDEAKTPAVPSGESREALVRAAMESMVAMNVREEFSASGAPHTKTLSTRVGFTVNNKERDLIWAALRRAE